MARAVLHRSVAKPPLLLPWRQLWIVKSKLESLGDLFTRWQLLLRAQGKDSSSDSHSLAGEEAAYPTVIRRPNRKSSPASAEGKGVPGDKSSLLRVPGRRAWPERASVLLRFSQGQFLPLSTRTISTILSQIHFYWDTEIAMRLPPLSSRGSQRLCTFP